MIESKPWDWSKNDNDIWLIPAIESYYLAESWKSKGYESLLDLGCGLGRHSIYFAKKGFHVSAIDLSEYAVVYLNNWAKRERLNIATQVCDMLNLPSKGGEVNENQFYRTSKQLREISSIGRNLKHIY